MLALRLGSSVAGFSMVIGKSRISVQFGPYAYCGDYPGADARVRIPAPTVKGEGRMALWEREHVSQDAEVAIMHDSGGEWQTREVYREMGYEDPGNNVARFQDAERVACIIGFLAMKALEESTDD